MSHHPQLKKHRLDNGDYPYENGHLNDISRLEKSPLLANGYNPPPTHLNHMQFMQMNHHPGAALLNPSMPPHGMPRPDGAMMKGASGMPGMDAIARSGIWENCRAAYEDIVKHLERLREERGEDRAVALDQKPRDLSSQNGSSNGHSPVLNLSKSNIDHNSADDRSDRSEGHSPVPSVRDEEENLSEENVSEIDDREEKEEDISDAEQDHHHPPPPPATAMANSAECQQAINYSTLAATAAAVAATGGPPTVPGQDPSSLSSTETLLRNIQSLLKVAADNARQQERQITYEKDFGFRKRNPLILTYCLLENCWQEEDFTPKLNATFVRDGALPENSFEADPQEVQKKSEGAELKMDVLREREVKDSLERQLSDEQKLRAIYQKRFKKEKRARIRLQQQLDMEMKRRAQLEDAIKASGAPAEALRLISENVVNNERRERRSASSERRAESPYQPPNRADPPSGGPPNSAPNDGKPWNYSNLDMMATESLAQELEIERKARQQSGERDVKSPLQDRPNYYKNSILFSSAT
ncbi:dachshund homolog 1 [Sergentomyia squamirostris]